MTSNLLKNYKKLNHKRILIIIVLFILLFLSIQVSMLLGTFDVNIHNIKEFWTDKDSTLHQVITRIRLPRIIAAVLTGAVLSVSGTVSQSLLRNPLASPFTLGISGASAFGAAFSIIFLDAGDTYSSTSDAIIINNKSIIGISAFLWSLVSIFIIIFLSHLKKSNPQSIILCGVVLSSLFGAGTSAIQYFSNDTQLASIVFWSFGDMGRANWDDILLIGSIFSLSFIYFIRKSWSYNSLKTGDEYAKSLGIKPERIRLTGMIVSSLLTAITVSFFGIIGFIGLLGPHIMRRIIGSHEAYLIPSSAAFGGLLLLIADTFARTIISPIILPVGIITSFLGAPLFIFLLIKEQNNAD